MSKRPTFNELISAYAQAVQAAAVGGLTEDLVQQSETAHATLTRALRKAGVPLDQVAPQ